MIKDVDGYFLTGSLNRKYIVKVRPFSSVKTNDMEYYITPTKRVFGPGIYILHVRTNDVTLDHIPEELIEHIVNIATSLKTESNTVAILSIVPRGDSKKEKAEAVNKLLVDICEQKEISLTDHSNINTKRHLNKADDIFMLIVNLFLLKISEIFKNVFIDGTTGITKIK